MNCLSRLAFGGVLCVLFPLSTPGTPPANDNLTNLTVLTGNFVRFTGTLVDATIEPDEMQQYSFSHSGDRSVWWRWTATDPSPVTIYVERSYTPVDPPDTAGIAVIGHDGPIAHFVDFSSWGQAPTLTLRTAKVHADLSFVPVPGRDYYIQALGGCNATFDLVLVATNAPVIVTQPQSVTANSGASVLFAVMPAGNVVLAHLRPFGYQWKFNGVDLPEGNAAILGITNVTAAQAGDYVVVITNQTGSVTSQVAHLTVSDLEARPLLRITDGSSPTGIGLSIEGEAGRCYRIESSSNLVDWIEEKRFAMIPDQLSVPLLTSVMFASNSPTAFSMTNNWKQKFIRARRYFPANEVCNLSLKKIRLAKELWMRDWGFTSVNDIMSHSELLPYLGYTNFTPFFNCPLHGTYGANAVGKLPECSISGHLLEEPR